MEPFMELSRRERADWHRSDRVLTPVAHDVRDPAKRKRGKREDCDRLSDEADNREGEANGNADRDHEHHKQ